MRLILIFLIILLCLFVPFKTIHAEGEILFSDNFSDGNLDGWIVENGNWFINSGNLSGSKSGINFGGRISNTEAGWENYILEVDFNVFSGIDAGVGFRHIQGESGYELNLRAGTGIFDTPQIILRKAQDGVVSIIGDTHSFPLINGKWYHLKVEINGENIKVWVDSTAIFDITDANTKVKTGGITFSYWTGLVGVVFTRFDNIKVTKLAPPVSKTPLIIIPGIGGSELKLNQDTFWSKDDGHGGSYHHAYIKDEKVWVNETEAAKVGDDDYFDVLRMKEDGVTSEVDISVTDNLYAGAYQQTIDFFTNNGYTFNKDLFIFPYDWRKDLSLTAELLDEKISQIKSQTGAEQVDIVAHSMGGLVARNYISDPQKAQYVRKLFTLGTPHLGATEFLKSIRYGGCLKYPLGSFCLTLAPSEMKDVIQNMISGFELAPSQEYFNFYTGEDNTHPYPYRTESEPLNYPQIKNLLTTLEHNTALFNPSEIFHSIDSNLSNTNGVDVINIVGSGKSTLGQIIEQKTTSLLGIESTKKDVISINGDDTVPLFSASLNDPSKNLSYLGSAKIYYTNQKHGDLVVEGSALNLIKNILEGNNQIPSAVSNEPYKLNGVSLSVHSPANIHIYDSNGNHTGPTQNGDTEVNIPGSSYDTLDDAKFIYLPDNGIYTIKFEATDQGSFDFKIRKFEDDINTQTILYEDISLTNETEASTIFDTQSPLPPVIQVDENGDGDIDFNVNSFSILKGDVNYDHMSPQVSFDVNPKIIWPPNGKMVDINILGQISDENPYLITILVDDEYDQVEPSITTYNQTEYNQTIKLKAARNDEDKDGRTYTIRILVKDLAGNTAYEQLKVVVPHDSR